MVYNLMEQPGYLKVAMIMWNA